MKSQKGLKVKEHPSDSYDVIRKPAKLEPARKSGKERHSIFGIIDDDADELEEEFRKRESVLDYFDDGEEEE